MEVVRGGSRCKKWDTCKRIMEDEEGRIYGRQTGRGGGGRPDLEAIQWGGLEKAEVDLGTVNLGGVTKE